MKTIRPLSSISYNTVPFLTDMLNKLVKSGDLFFWCFIEHLPEEDENKKHIHLFIHPSNKVDPLQIMKMSEQFVNGNALPLKCINLRISDWDNWLLYAMHDEDYLRSKCEVRKYHYSVDDFYYSDKDEFGVRVYETMHNSMCNYETKISRMMRKQSCCELVAKGYIRPKDAFYYGKYEIMRNEGLYIEKCKIADANKNISIADVDNLPNTFVPLPSSTHTQKKSNDL